jgi:hypothetical protein
MYKIYSNFLYSKYPLLDKIAKNVGDQSQLIDFTAETTKEVLESVIKMGRIPTQEEVDIIYNRLVTK